MSEHVAWDAARGSIRSLLSSAVKLGEIDDRDAEWIGRYVERHSEQALVAMLLALTHEAYDLPRVEEAEI